MTKPPLFQYCGGSGLYGDIWHDFCSLETYALIGKGSSEKEEMNARHRSRVPGGGGDSGLTWRFGEAGSLAAPGLPAGRGLGAVSAASRRPGPGLQVLHHLQLVMC